MRISEDTKLTATTGVTPESSALLRKLITIARINNPWTSLWHLGHGTTRPAENPIKLLVRTTWLIEKGDSAQPQHKIRSPCSNTLKWHTQKEPNPNSKPIQTLRATPSILFNQSYEPLQLYANIHRPTWGSRRVTRSWVYPPALRAQACKDPSASVRKPQTQ